MKVIVSKKHLRLMLLLVLLVALLLLVGMLTNSV